MNQALQNFVGEPLRLRRFDLAWYRLSQFLHDRTNGGYDAVYMQLARFLRPKVRLPDLPKPQVDEVRDVVANLRRDGYMILPELLPARDVEEIKTFAFSTPGVGADFNKRIPISSDNIPEGEARFYWWMDELAAVPAVRRLITDGFYCAIAQEYLGCRPVLAHISLFLDRPFTGKYEPYAYHYDNEGPGLSEILLLPDGRRGRNGRSLLHGRLSGPHKAEAGRARGPLRGRATICAVRARQGSHRPRSGRHDSRRGYLRIPSRQQARARLPAFAADSSFPQLRCRRTRNCSVNSSARPLPAFIPVSRRSLVSCTRPPENSRRHAADCAGRFRTMTRVTHLLALKPDK